MYFAFLRSYFAALVPPSVVGFMTWAAGGSFSPLYSFAIVLWSVLFVEWWRIRERILAVRWGTYNASLATPRAQFKGIVDKIDPITGEQKKSQPWHVTELRQLFSVPILLGAAAVLIFCICGIFTTEVLLTEVYTGPGQAVLKYLPIVLFAGIVPQVSLCSSDHNVCWRWDRRADLLTLLVGNQCLVQFSAKADRLREPRTRSTPRKITLTQDVCAECHLRM